MCCHWGHNAMHQVINGTSLMHHMHCFHTSFCRHLAAASMGHLLQQYEVFGVKLSGAQCTTECQGPLHAAQALCLLPWHPCLRRKTPQTLKTLQEVLVRRVTTFWHCGERSLCDGAPKWHGSTRVAGDTACLLFAQPAPCQAAGCAAGACAAAATCRWVLARAPEPAAGQQHSGNRLERRAEQAAVPTGSASGAAPHLPAGPLRQRRGHARAAAAQRAAQEALARGGGCRRRCGPSALKLCGWKQMRSQAGSQHSAAQCWGASFTA